LRREGAELELSTDEGGARHDQVASGRHGRHEPFDRPGLDLADPLCRHAPDRAEPSNAGGQAPREGAGEDLARCRRGLESRGQIDALAGDEELIGLGRPGRDLAGVHTDAELDPLHRSDIRHGERGEHRVRRAKRTLGIVFVGIRYPKDGHHRVADEFLDRRAMLNEDLARSGEEGTEPFAHDLGVVAHGQGGGPHDVGEEDRDEPSLLRHLGSMRPLDAPATLFATRVGGVTCLVMPAVSAAWCRSRSIRRIP